MINQRISHNDISKMICEEVAKAMQSDLMYTAVTEKIKHKLSSAEQGKFAERIANHHLHKSSIFTNSTVVDGDGQRDLETSDGSKVKDAADLEVLYKDSYLRISMKSNVYAGTATSRYFRTDSYRPRHMDSLKMKTVKASASETYKDPLAAYREMLAEDAYFLVISFEVATGKTLVMATHYENIRKLTPKTMSDGTVHLYADDVKDVSYSFGFSIPQNILNEADKFVDQYMERLNDLTFIEDIINGKEKEKETMQGIKIEKDGLTVTLDTESLKTVLAMGGINVLFGTPNTVKEASICEAPRPLVEAPTECLSPIQTQASRKVYRISEEVKTMRRKNYDTMVAKGFVQQCKICHKDKPVLQYQFAPRNTSGIASTCKACIKEQRKNSQTA